MRPVTVVISDPPEIVPVVTDALGLETLQLRLKVASCNMMVLPTQSELAPVIGEGGVAIVID